LGAAVSTMRPQHEGGVSTIPTALPPPLCAACANPDPSRRCSVKKDGPPEVEEKATFTPHATPFEGHSRLNALSPRGNVKLGDVSWPLNTATVTGPVPNPAITPPCRVNLQFRARASLSARKVHPKPDLGCSAGGRSRRPVAGGPTPSRPPRAPRASAPPPRPRARGRGAIPIPPLQHAASSAPRPAGPSVPPEVRHQVSELLR